MDAMREQQRQFLREIAEEDRIRKSQHMQVLRLIFIHLGLIVSALLFCLGLLGVIVRRNVLIIYMSLELMLNAGNLAFVTFSRMHGQLDGQVVAFFTMVVAACEVVVGLAIIMTIFRTRRSANVDDAHLLRH